MLRCSGGGIGRAANSVGGCVVFVVVGGGCRLHKDRWGGGLVSS